MSGLTTNTPQGAFDNLVEGDAPLTPKNLAARLGIRDIQCPADGWLLRVPAGGIKIDLSDGPMTVTVQYVAFRRPRAATLYPLPSGFGPKMDEALTPSPVASTGGYIVPPDLADAVRTGLQIIGQPVATPLEPELSDWIDGSVKPTLAGVYQRRWPATPNDVWYFRFDGAVWRSCSKSVWHAYTENDTSTHQALPWRGLRFPLGFDSTQEDPR